MKEKEILHIAMYPWFAMGHFTAFLHLSNKLAERGHKISFFIPINTQSKLVSHNHHPDLITFIPIIVPAVDGLPVGAETTNAAPGDKIIEAMDLTRDIIDSHLARLKPNYIFFDFMQWIPELGRKHGAKTIYYAITYMASMAYFSPHCRNLPGFQPQPKEEVARPPSNFPCPGFALQAHEVRVLVHIGEMNIGGGMKIMDRQNICYQECDAFAVKTCREMEGAYCDYIQKHWRKQIFLVGPVIPDLPCSKLDDEINGWLNGFSRDSVVYCALGSECILEKCQFLELVLGLELTGRPFLAALKPPKGYKTIESALPEGYAERIKDRGMINGGWVQQQLVINHPSVGCFITHCGGGSLSEAIVSECQIVMFPQSVDQFVNARLMSLDLRVGVELVERDSSDSFFTREGINEAVSKVMDPQSDIGMEVRANHTKWRNVVLAPGLEDSYIDGFVKSLQDLL